MKSLLFPLCLATCVSLTTAAAEPVPVIFDTDMANDCDDAGALAVLHALADRGEARILAVVTNRKDPSNASAAAVDAINTFYGRGTIPIGTDKDGAKPPGQGRRPSSYCENLRDHFPHDALPDAEMPDAVTVLRTALAAQPDNSVVICSVGALSNLEDLLRSDFALVQSKVLRLIVMGGGFPRTIHPETNIRLDPAAAVTVTNQWPTPILWQGYEVGAAMRNGAVLKQSPTDNPVRRAYELRPFHELRAIDRGKPNHDLAAVLLAVRGAEPGFWTVVSGGRAVFDSDGHCRWRPEQASDQAYVRIKGHPQKIEQLLADLLAAEPSRGTPL